MLPSLISINYLYFSKYRILGKIASFTTQISRKPTMSFCTPRFVLHDFEEQEESKVIRMIFAYINIPYEFKEIQRTNCVLEDYPFYSIPMLEVDNRKLGSVLSICRQLGWRSALSGRTVYDDSQVDMIGEKTFAAKMRLKNWLDHIEHRKAHFCDDSCTISFATTYLEFSLMPVIEDILEKSQSPWLVGNSMSWADLMVCCFFNPIIYHYTELFERYPHIYLHNKRIAELEVFRGFLYNVRDRKFK